MKETAATNFIWTIFLPITIATLLLRPSLDFTTLHPTTLHSTSLHLWTLHFFPFKIHPNTLPTLHDIFLWFNSISISHRSVSPHFTTLHLTSVHYIASHFTSLHHHFTSMPTTILFATMVISKVKFLFSHVVKMLKVCSTGNKTRVPQIGIFIYHMRMSQLILAYSHYCIADYSFEFL